MAAQRKQENPDAGFEPAPAPAEPVAPVETAIDAGLPVLDDLKPAPSPARALQAELEDRIMKDGMIAISPRQVLATIIVICLAFWFAIFQLTAAIF